MTSRTLKTTLIAALVTTAISGAYLAGGMPTSGLAHASAAEANTAAPATPPVVAAPQTALPDMSAIVARYGAAVVNISVSGKVKTSAGIPDAQSLDPNDLFGEFARRFRLPQQQGETPVRGQGSGFVLRADGVVLTNAHVVDGADEVTVKLIDKREFRAKVLGVDKQTDVAVLKIDAQNLPTLKIGSAANTRVGEWVLAIGSPFGFENSASAGIVSAKSRSLPDDNYVPFIQTDVAVNPGNSGGPLFNMAGEVIGINSQIYSRTGGYQGVSFAIPIEVAMNVEEQIVKTGKVQRGRLGISIQTLNPALAESFGLKTASGALVSSVENGSPAAKAGLEPGDVILALNGKAISSSSELPLLVAEIAPGKSARLTIWRKGGSRELDVTVGAQPGEKVASAPSKAAAPGPLGLTLRPLTPDERQQIDSKSGLLVENASGAAARAGIRAGDVVLSINGEPVGKVEQARGLIARSGKRVAVLIQRDEIKLFVPVDLG